MWQWALNANNEENRPQMSSTLCHEVICMCSTGHAVVGWPAWLHVNFKTFLRGIPLEWSQGKLDWMPQRSLHAKPIELNLLTPLLMCCVHIYRETFVNFTVGNTSIKNHVRISAHSCKLHAFGRKKKEKTTAPSVGLSGLMHFNSLGTSFKFRTWLKCQHQQIKAHF